MLINFSNVLFLKISLINIAFVSGAESVLVFRIAWNNPGEENV